MRFKRHFSTISLNTLTRETIKENWYNPLCITLEQIGISSHFYLSGKIKILKVGNELAISLIDIINPFSPDDLLAIQQAYQIQNVKLVHLWEDVWLSRPEQVLARIQSLLGSNKRIHGRKTAVKRISRPIADVFLNTNHLQGTVTARYKMGLFLGDELVAVASFSGLRKMNYSESYRSAELIRFAVKAGYSVTGGLSKLISAFEAEFKPQDIMTYSDNDWSAGNAYFRLGFKQTGILKPQYFNLDDNFQRSLEKEANNNISPKVFNTGSLKFILKF